jgi:serine O-acetyltransferase
MLKMLKCDIERYKSHPNEGQFITVVKALYSHPSFIGVIWYRLSRYLWLRKDRPVFLLILIGTRALYPLVRLYSGLELSPTADIGAGLWIGHFGPTVINPAIKAGQNLTILHGVTIGAGTGGQPQLGNNVSIGTGATIIGGVIIGNNVIIGAGAVVTKDIPSGSIAVGIPAQALPAQQNELLLENSCHPPDTAHALRYNLLTKPTQVADPYVRMVSPSISKHCHQGLQISRFCPRDCR